MQIQIFTDGNNNSCGFIFASNKNAFMNAISFKDGLSPSPKNFYYLFQW